MKLTYYGHSCFAVEIKGKNILFDPFITYNELAKNVDVNTIEADYIFLSHGHEDHIADCISVATRTGAKVVCSFEIHTWLNNKGISNTHPMNTGGKWHFDFGTVKCVTAHHSSGLPDGSYGGNPMGFVFTSGEGNFYYSGDTALSFDMQLIPAYAPVDFAVLPIGDNFTMDAGDAATAAKFVDCQKVLGVHYDTFGYIKIDHQQAKDLFAQQGITLWLLNPGEKLDI
ncbi:MAG: metal-dependent hydrolase [Chitinophagaceae bacterium]|nr:metal-dependent hydrolase [Chitinophagaceae bacterium]MCW5927102.1 metal-dependent hydrolase [Chitinophagaceae bacterium]